MAELQPLMIKEASYYGSITIDQDLWYHWLPMPWYDWFFPPEVPAPFQLMRKENLAIPASYILVGLLQGVYCVGPTLAPNSCEYHCTKKNCQSHELFASSSQTKIQGFGRPFVNVYPLDLNATEAQQTTLSGVLELPASLKLLFGFISDIYPFLGYRRKSYMFFGWALSSLSMFVLLFFSDLRLVNNIDIGGERFLQQPTIPFLSFTLLLSSLGYWVADVMADALVVSHYFSLKAAYQRRKLSVYHNFASTMFVNPNQYIQAEKAKLEPEEVRGHLQSSCYACRFFGLMVAAPCSTYIYSNYGPHVVVFIMAVLPLSILPLVYLLWEPQHSKMKSVRSQCDEIFETVCSRSVWQPMGFVYLYNILQVGNAAWKEYLRSVLGFSSSQLNTLLIIAYVLLYLGVVTYKYYFIKCSWRIVYVSTTLLNGLFSALQLLLIQGITFGLTPFLFALGDDVFSDFIGGIQFLPTTIMVCPFVFSHSIFYVISFLCNATQANAWYTIHTTVFKLCSRWCNFVRLAAKALLTPCLPRFPTQQGFYLVL